MGVRDPIASLVCTASGSIASVDVSATESVFEYDPLLAGQILWGDGSDTPISVPFSSYTHSYVTAGTYVVVFWVWTSHGRRARAEATVTVSGSISSLIHQANRTLNNDQIIALPTVPVELAAAPGGNKGIIPITATLNASFTSGYVIQVPADSWLGILAGEAQLRLGTTAWNLRAASSPWTVSIGPAVAESFPLTSGGTSVDPLIILAANDDGDPTYNTINFGGGNALNTLRVSVEFRVYDSVLNRYLTTSESGWNETTRLFE